MAAIFLPDYDLPANIPSDGARTRVPKLRVIQGGAVRSSEFRRRRRQMTLLVGMSCAVLVLVALSATLFSLIGAPQTPPVSSPSAGATNSAASVIVVQQGDTLSSIARRLQPTGDTSGLVSRLAASHGPSPLLAGDRLDVGAIPRTGR